MMHLPRPPKSPWTALLQLTALAFCLLGAALTADMIVDALTEYRNGRELHR